MIPTKFYKQILKHYKNVENFIKISTSNSKHVTKHKTSYYKTYQKQQPQNNKLLIKPYPKQKLKKQFSKWKTKNLLESMEFQFNCIKNL